MKESFYSILGFIVGCLIVAFISTFGWIIGGIVIIAFVVKDLFSDYRVSRIHYNLGNICKKLLKFNWAIREYDKAIQLYPNGEWIYYERGNTYFIIGQYELALKDYDKALELNSYSIAACCNRERCLRAMGR